MCSCTIWAKHDIILFRVALGFLLLIAYPFVCSGRHELYANGAAQGNALSGGAIAIWRAKDGGVATNPIDAMGGLWYHTQQF